MLGLSKQCSFWGKICWTLLWPPWVTAGGSSILGRGIWFLSWAIFWRVLIGNGLVKVLYDLLDMASLKSLTSKCFLLAYYLYMLASCNNSVE